MEARLLRTEREGADALQVSKQSMEIVRNFLQQLREYITSYTFTDTQQEVRFFKRVKPRFYSRLIYYLRVFYLETHCPAASYSLQQELLQEELKRIKYFFRQNLDFYNYYSSGATYLDEQLFTRGNCDLLLAADEYSLVLDQAFSTVHSYKLSRILAYNALQQYLEKALRQIGRVERGGVSTLAFRDLRWTGSKTDMIELLYGLQGIGVFNNGEADIKAVAALLEQAFGISLGNYYRIFQEMRIRKGTRTLFLDRLREMVIKRMDSSDEWGVRK
jgi:hypothetical protein